MMPNSLQCDGVIIMSLSLSDTHVQANNHQSPLMHQASLDTEAAAIGDDLYVNDSIDELSDSQSQCSTMSQEQEKSTAASVKESRKERDRPPTAKKRKYKHHK